MPGVSTTSNAGSGGFHGARPDPHAVQHFRHADALRRAAFDGHDAIEARAPPSVARNAAWPGGGRPLPPGFDPRLPPLPPTFRFGVPVAPRFFGDAEAEALYSAALDRAEAVGGTRVPVDLTPFEETASLLYGPWAAERTAAVSTFLTERPDALHSVTRGILQGSAAVSAVELFRAQHRLAALARAARPVWDGIDALLRPTTGTAFTVGQALAEPLRRNNEQGATIDFVNLLDLAAIAVPSGFPVGITLATAVAAVAVPAVQPAGLAQGNPANPTRAETLLLVQEYGPNNLDMQGIDGAQPVNGVALNCYDRLVRLKRVELPDGTMSCDLAQLEPELAECWQEASDGTSVTFTLRDGARCEMVARPRRQHRRLRHHADERG